MRSIHFVHWNLGVWIISPVLLSIYVECHLNIATFILHIGLEDDSKVQYFYNLTPPQTHPEPSKIKTELFDSFVCLRRP